MKNHRLQAAALGRRRTPDEIARLLDDHRQSGLSLLAFNRGARARADEFSTEVTLRLSWIKPRKDRLQFSDAEWAFIW